MESKVSESVKKKVDNQTPEKVINNNIMNSNTNVSQIITTDNVVIQNSGTENNTNVNVPQNIKTNNVGLQKPGSNWKKYRNVITGESTPTNQPSNEIEIRKKKPHKKRSKKRNKETSQLNEKNQISKVIVKENKEVESQNELTTHIAMDCEMVGIRDGQDSMIARVSIVNEYGTCIYDKYVKPTEKVQDYRTKVSGIRPHHLKTGEDFKIVQQEVADILKGRILVGHALHNDLNVLFLSHPRRFQRDSSRYFRRLTPGNIPSLKRLASDLLGLDIQCGEHDSIEDARTTMQLYKLFKIQWENDNRRRR